MGGFELTGLEGKVAVVTGAGRMRSIGRPIATELARAGCDVVVTGSGRDPARYPDEEKDAGWRDIDSVADEVRAQGRRALAVVSDVGDLAAVEALADKVCSELGRVDFVVNNASYARGEDRTALVDLDPDLWRKVIDTNLTGAFYMCKVFGRRLIDRAEGGAIVNISSVSGKMLPGHMAAYAASKAGLQALTVSMAKDVARRGIRVNAICPGLIDTSRMGDMDDAAWDRAVAQVVPLGRRGYGADVAAMTVFLCSDQASWITGQLYNVDGGTTHA